MYYFLVALMILASLLMCVVVMVQNSKGGGLSSAFASSNQIMGVRKTTDFIEKLTWGIAVFMVVISVLTAYTIPQRNTATSVMTEEALKDSGTNPLNAPQGFAAPTPETSTTAPADAEATSPATTEEAPASAEPAQ